jgi:hypothetical protein
MDELGELPVAFNFGGCWRWSVDEVKRWLDEGAPRRQRDDLQESDE